MKKWLFYYGAAVLAILLAALLAPQAIVLHATSSVPVLCAVLLLVLTSKWYFTKGGRRSHDTGFKFVKIKGQKGYFEGVQEKNELPFEADERRIWMAARLLAPAFFPFAVFFSPWNKLWSLLLLALFGVAVLIYETVYWQREAKKAKEQKEKDLREQERREELGNWK